MKKEQAKATDENRGSDDSHVADLEDGPRKLEKVDLRPDTTAGGFSELP